MVLVGRRLYTYALAHGVRQKVAHLGVAADAVDVVDLVLEWCCLVPLAQWCPGAQRP